MNKQLNTEAAVLALCNKGSTFNLKKNENKLTVTRGERREG